MVLYSKNSISFKISNSDNSSIDSTILPEKLQNNLDKGFVSDKTNNHVLTRLFNIFTNLGGFDNLDLKKYEEIEENNKKRIKNIYRRIKNRYEIYNFNIDNENIDVIWELIIKIIRKNNVLENKINKETISLFINEKKIDILIFTIKSLIIPLLNKYSLDKVVEYFERVFFDSNYDTSLIQDFKLSFQSDLDRKDFLKKLNKNRKLILKSILNTFKNEYQLIEKPDNLEEIRYKGILKWIYSILIRNN